MTIDPSIREQSYRYFLQEAPELLQVLEQDLLSLQEDFSTNKVNNLMRTTHTLKGAAASVGLETIKTVAHSLEDVFKALFNPNVLIDSEVEALLFEGYECLRLPLIAELTGGQVNQAEVLDRTATIFAQLQEKLGDYFSQEDYIPSSAELGFDLTQSIFEVGVAQRLDEISQALASAQPSVVATTLRTQAEVFLGLAESLGLSGFGDIAKAAIAALDTNPQQVLTIAQVALSDLQQAQAAVLNGDRRQGGQLSLTLQQLSGIGNTEAPVNPSGLAVHGNDLVETEKDPERGRIPPDSLTSSPENVAVDAQESATQRAIDLESVEKESPNEESANPLLEAIWGGEAVLVDSQTAEPGELVSADSISATSHHEENSNSADSTVSLSQMLPSLPVSEVELSGRESMLGNEPEFTLTTLLSPNLETERTPTFSPQKDHSQSRTVRVNVEHLDHLNDSVGELLTNQNHQLLQNEQLRVAVRELLARFQQHQQLLNQLQDWSFRLFTLSEQRQAVKSTPNSEGSLGMTGSSPSLPRVTLLPKISGQQRLQREVEGFSGQPTPLEISQRVSIDGGFAQLPLTFSTEVKGASLESSLTLDRFDSLELDRYSESQLLVQSILEDSVQLAETAEAIDLFTRQANQTLEKQRRLLTSTRDALMEARMLPLGDVFGRFPRVLKQLEALHNKQVAMELRGTEVLVDKIVAEKLHGPLLHLVRNAFAHGIEPSTVRQQQGKPQKGLIEICAYHRGRSLFIEVRDDGQGLDFEQIRQQAVENQLVSPERASSLSQAQLTNLLFEAGFSTASKVNDLSGRGIGLDVVRDQLQSLQGAVVVDSQPNRGTTFVLEIPLSLTIAKLLLVQAGEQIYALTTNAIEQILIPQADQVRNWEGGKALRWGKGADERLVPVHQLTEVLDDSPLVSESLVSPLQTPLIPKGQAMPMILFRYQDKFLCLEVDQLLGEQELVIRPLGTMIVPPDYVYGGSILADGRLTLALDGAALMQYVFNQQASHSHDSQPFEARESLTTRYPNSSTFPMLPAQNRAALPALAPALDSKIRPDEIGESGHQNRPGLSPSSANLFKTVLIVDDSITLRQTLALALQKAGYHVLQAKDGYEALEQLRHHQNIQLVLCDIEMPRMNGFEFLKQHQQDPTLADVPVAILTSRSGEKHRLIALELGASAYMTKPFLEHHLLATVKDVIEKNIRNSVSI